MGEPTDQAGTYVDADPEESSAELRPDAPMSFDSGDQRYRSRTVAQFTVEKDNPSRTDQMATDWFEALGGL
jgi:hypothetical protein